MGRNLSIRAVVFMKKWELSLLIAVIAAIVCCAVRPEPTMRWWTAAFSPLCDQILTADCDTVPVSDGDGEDLLLRSKLLEFLEKAVTHANEKDAWWGFYGNVPVFCAIFRIPIDIVG